MSWSHVFPVLSQEHVEAYEANVTAKERSLHESWFAVQRVINPRDVAHVVSTSLFWKNIRMALPPIIIKNRATLMNAGKREQLLRFNPWTHYVEPLLKGAHWLHKRRQDAAFRVYLAADMEFLVPDLVAAGCEVRLMESNSLAHNPGAMWRFLAFEDEGKMVTIVDADRAAQPEADMARTEEAKRMGLGWWRVPVWGELNEIGNTSYRPILGCQFGTNQTLAVQQIMQALIWHTEHKLIETNCHLPGCKSARVHGSIWPDYGYDEWFLQTAVYPRAAFDGILSFIPADAKSRLLPLDIEFTSFANPASEMVYFGSTGGGCCGPATGHSKEENHTPKRGQGKVNVRKETTVLLRGNDHAYERMPLFGKARVQLIGPEADLAQTLELAVTQINAEWWVDLGTRLVQDERGAELFLDRRYDACDVAVSGSYFHQLSQEESTWARKRGADKGRWTEGSLLKLPKLSGTPTLWRHEFCRRLYAEWGKHPQIPIPVLLALWQETGKARPVTCSARDQGWNARL